jgi:hypothetical protein
MFAVATISGAFAGTVTTTSVALAATVLTVSGNTLVVHTPMEQQLGGTMCQAPNTCEQVQYPAGSIGQGPLDEGEMALQDKIATTTGNKVVMAYSQGGIIATNWLEQHAGDPDAPPAGELTFVLFGNPQRAGGGLAQRLGSGVPTPTDTQYTVVDITREYDGEADWPDDPLNGLAVANALAGYFFVHTDYTNVDVNSPDNLVKKVDKTTYVLVPTDQLPLLQPLRLVGLNGVADALNAPLKKVVDAGYDRSAYAPAAEPVLPAAAAQTELNAASTGGPLKASSTGGPLKALTTRTQRPVETVRFHSPAANPLKVGKPRPAALSLGLTSSKTPTEGASSKTSTEGASSKTSTEGADMAGTRTKRPFDATLGSVREGLRAHREQSAASDGKHAHIAAKNDGSIKDAARAVARALSK